jgi:glutamyl-tRNA synthetase
MPNPRQNKKIRVRIAPSPTGPLHLGTARTALFNYLFARQHKGKFILRIEDTDVERSEKKYEKDIIENLKWLGLEWDEGPYRQSERAEIYQKYIKKLLDSSQAFWCYHTKEELEKEKKEQMKRGEAPRHICRPTTNNKQQTTKKGIIRFRCPDKKIVFNDLIRGQLEFNAGLLGDIGIARDEKTPLYNLGVVIDDYEMGISHVIRGEDHISNTPKQILLGQALGFPQPQFAHLPLILGSDRSKLSKRHGAVSVGWYKEEGYLSEALINFIALLGWNPGTEKEIFSLEELIKEFSLERVQKGGAVFNLQRLNWLNGYYIRQMDLDELTKKCIPYLVKAKLIIPLWGQKEIITGWYKFPFGITDYQTVKTKEKLDFSYLKKIVALEQERLKKLSEIGELTKFFFVDKLKYEPELLIWKKMTLKEVKASLDILEEALSKVKEADFEQEKLKGILMPLTEKHGSGELLWPLRVALTGQKASPGPFEIMEVLGKEKTLKRVKEAKVLLGDVL